MFGLVKFNQIPKILSCFLVKSERTIFHSNVVKIVPNLKLTAVDQIPKI